MRPPTWDTVVVPLADALDRLDRAWGAVSHLNAVVNTPALRDAYNANLPKVTAFHTDLAQDERLYARYQALAAIGGLRGARCRAAQASIDNELRDFRLGGAELPSSAEGAVQGDRRRSWPSCRAEFDDNVLDATNA